MYPGDARSKWPSALLTDQRVAHYCDEQRALGTAYLSNLPAMLDRRAEATLQPTADAMWDAFFRLFADSCAVSELFKGRQPARLQPRADAGLSPQSRQQ